VKRLATAPLNDQPGTKFRYGYSIDVLGRLVEVVSGKKLDQFFEERIFRPLGMTDTAFFVPEEKWNRLAVLYAPKQGGGIQRSMSPAQESFKKKPALLLGGAGLTSTLDDYARFCMMLLNDGELDNVRILSRKSVELMRSDHLGDLPRAGLLGDGDGFGPKGACRGSNRPLLAFACSGRIVRPQPLQPEHARSRIPRRSPRDLLD
jgi:CubicO group peptidase (beta-lactamase class C family)